MRFRRRLAIALFLLVSLTILSGCGDRAARCTPFHKGFPLCGL